MKKTFIELKSNSMTLHQKENTDFADRAIDAAAIVCGLKYAKVTNSETRKVTLKMVSERSPPHVRYSENFL